MVTSPSASTRVDRGRLHRWLLPLIVGVAAWLGMLLVLYPSIAAWFSAYNQSLVIGSYMQHSEVGLEPSAAEQIRLARAYNAELSSGALLAPNERLPQGEGTSSANSGPRYEELLRADPSGVMGRLRVPTADVDLPIYHGTSDAVLLEGVGHLEGTSLPVGGEDTHSVLTAHRGLASAKMFTDLNLVSIGDTFTITVFDQVLTYQVFDIKVVDPSETETLRQVPGRDLVTLVTCTPLGINSQRILVTGTRVEPTPTADEVAGSTAPAPWTFPWWAVILAGGTAGVGVYLWRATRPRPRREAAPEPADA